MIEVKVSYDTDGRFTAFNVSNHGDSYVCSAVSMLVINTINCIELMTDEPFTCDIENEQSINFMLNKTRGEKAGLLLDAMLHGLKSVKEQYPEQIKLLTAQNAVL